MEPIALAGTVEAPRPLKGNTVVATKVSVKGLFSSESWAFDVTVTDSSKHQVVLAGLVGATFVICQVPGGAELPLVRKVLGDGIGMDIDPIANPGVLHIILSPVETQPLNNAELYCELELIWPDGEVRKVLYGTVEVLPTAIR